MVGDSFFSEPLLLIRDLNRDGDALDAGEVTPFPVPLPVLQGSSPPLPFSLAYRPGAPTRQQLRNTIRHPGSERLAKPPQAVAAERHDASRQKYHEESAQTAACQT